MVIVAQFGFLSIRPDEMRFAAFLKTNIFGPKSMKKLYIAYTIGNVVLVKTACPPNENRIGVFFGVLYWMSSIAKTPAP